MKKTDNRIPEPLLKALTYNNYDGKSTLSASSLNEPIRIKILKMRHSQEIENIPEENTFLLIGNAVHQYIDIHDEGQKIDRLSINLKNDISISGKIDLYYNNCIYDFKDTSVYSFKYPIKDEYILQLNTYKFLMEKNGYSVDKLYLCYIYRDWSKSALINNFESSKPYPLSPVEIREVDIIDNSNIIDIIINKIEELMKFKETPDEELPICEDKWEDNRNKYPLRCLCYCNVNKFCNYYNNDIYEKYNKIIDFLNSRYFEEE